MREPKVGHFKNTRRIVFLSSLWETGERRGFHRHARGARRFGQHGGGHELRPVQGLPKPVRVRLLHPGQGHRPQRDQPVARFGGGETVRDLFMLGLTDKILLRIPSRRGWVRFTRWPGSRYSKSNVGDKYDVAQRADGKYPCVPPNTSRCPLTVVRLHAEGVLALRPGELRWDAS